MEILQGTDSTEYWGEPVDAPLGAYGNYVGPFWSNGERQTSVRWGDKAPVDAYDDAARRHDAAYANWPDDRHRMAADLIFMEEVRKEDKKTGRNMASDPAFAAKAVVYGNYAARRAMDIEASGGMTALVGTSMKKGKDIAKAGSTGLAGVALGEAKYIYDTQRMLEYNAKHGGSHYMREQEDVRDFYKTAPKPTKYSAKASSTAAKQQVDAIQEPAVAGSQSSVGKGPTSSERGTPLNPIELKGKQDFEPPPTQRFLTRKLAMRQYNNLKSFLGLRKVADESKNKKNSIVPMPPQQTQTNSGKTKKKKVDKAMPAQYRTYRKKSRVGAFPSTEVGRRK